MKDVLPYILHSRLALWMTSPNEFVESVMGQMAIQVGATKQEEQGTGYSAYTSNSFLYW
jgi:hypothetical protein